MYNNARLLDDRGYNQCLDDLSVGADSKGLLSILGSQLQLIKVKIDSNHITTQSQLSSLGFEVSDLKQQFIDVDPCKIKIKGLPLTLHPHARTSSKLS